MLASRRVLLPILLLLVIALAAAGCGGDPESPGDGKVIKLGLIEDLTGRNAEPGVGIRNSVELAVRQANARGNLGGHRIELVAKDGGDPAEATKAARELAADPAVAAVLCCVSSGVAQVVVPVLASSNVMMVAYSNTNPKLTLGPYPTTAPRRVWNNFVRLVPNDLIQGSFAADYAAERLHKRTVATVNDQKTFGLGLVSTFEAEWRNKGGRVASSNTIKEGDRDFGALAARIVAQKPDFVYYGGEAPEAGPLAAQLVEAGFTGPFMGGDTLVTEEMMRDAKGASLLATNGGLPVDKLPNAPRFVRDYSAARFKEPYGGYGLQAYDAAGLIIGAIGGGMAAGDAGVPTRSQLVDLIDRTQGYRGVTGEHTFDEFGDTSNKGLTVYRNDNLRWVSTYSAVVGG
jgi:branched-chain amino acid transport system substrate-binding protein